MFENRRRAGRVLAELLEPGTRGTDVVVLGLARGGVPVAVEIAAALHARLDVLVVRKLGAPQWPELAMGAIAHGGGMVLNEHVLRTLRIGDEQLAAVVASETAELERRERAYRRGAPDPELTAKTVVLADDGIATGATMLAAVRAVRTRAPTRVIVAVPVGPRSGCERLRDEADEVLIANAPRRFEAVGQVYAEFGQVTDAEVLAALGN